MMCVVVCLLVLFSCTVYLLVRTLQCTARSIWALCFVSEV